MEMQIRYLKEVRMKALHRGLSSPNFVGGLTRKEGINKSQSEGRNEEDKILPREEIPQEKDFPKKRTISV